MRLQLASLKKECSLIRVNPEFLRRELTLPELKDVRTAVLSSATVVLENLWSHPLTFGRNAFQRPFNCTLRLLLSRSIGAVVKVSPLDTFVFRRYQEYVTHRPVDEGQESCIPPPLKKEFDLLMLSHDCNFDRSVRQSSWEL
ncbi:hypothetical protein M513_06451 [Trichuris suis]|uniref:Uncharacterized protein n=1 Tax=Trichuris suis TaxID=68888 RepID=A0A085M5V8_9BILA|nr:hypothetical protein M513_06451 [Trichuris suis]